MKSQTKQYAGIFTIADSESFDEIYSRYEEMDGKCERLIFVDLRTFPALSLDDLIADLCARYKKEHPGGNDKYRPKNQI